ncbi:aminopeptidase P family protein [bacterium]|nr:aminopeptidase P family protein [candidate division CSSED10-310 bacterium]
MCGPIKYKTRTEKLRSQFTDLGIDGYLVTGLSNIRYLSGFDGYHGAVLLTRHHSLLLTDFTHFARAAEMIRHLKVRCLKCPLIEEIGQLTLRMKLDRLGFDPEFLSYAEYRNIKRIHHRLKLKPIPGFLKRAREIKDQEEIQVIRTSCNIAHRAFRSTLDLIRPGVSEKRIAAHLEQRMIEMGADRPAFNTIVLSGKRSVYPHIGPSENRIERHDTVIVDFGAKLNGYCSDCTRVLFPGRGGARQKNIYRIVLDALETALSVIKPGIRLGGVDRAGRDVIDRAGYGSFFMFPIGHGVGLDIHEAPIVDGTNDRIVEAGMVFSVEPGIYIPDWGGIRLEELVLVTPSGMEILTETDRDPPE